MTVKPTDTKWVPFFMSIVALLRIFYYFLYVLVWPNASHHLLGKILLALGRVDIIGAFLLLILSIFFFYPRSKTFISSLIMYYVSLVLTFATIYFAICLFTPLSEVAISGIGLRDIVFNVAFPNTERIAAFVSILLNCIHFSIVTMAAVGYMDMFPNAWYTKAIVDIQIILGLFYVVISVGKAVGYLAANNNKRRRKRY